MSPRLPKTKCICEGCGIDFFLTASELRQRKGKLHCTFQCRYRYKLIAHKDCAYCGKDFSYHPSDDNAQTRKYCSQECYRAGKTRAPQDRFWEKVAKGDGCWLWTASTRKNGYGWFGGLDISETFAHRCSWIYTFGAIPDGLCVLHRCDNPPCVRPDHLFLGTQYDNIKDMISKGRFLGKHLQSTHS